MKKNLIIAIILGVLVVISVIQAIQLNGLKEKISSGNLNVQTTSRVSSTSQGSNTPSNLQDLPSMVGGC